MKLSRTYLLAWLSVFASAPFLAMATPSATTLPALDDLTGLDASDINLWVLAFAGLACLIIAIWAGVKYFRRGIKG